MISHLLKIIRESIKAVPAMKYALAAAGLLAVVGLVGALKISPQAAVFGALLTLVLMVALVIFARLTTTASRHFLLPVQVMMWTFLVVTVASAVLLVTAAFFQWPRDVRELFGPKSVAKSPTIEVPDAADRVAAAQQQRRSRDYQGAWATIGAVLAASPQSTAAREEQLQVAMAWIREMRAPDASAFPALVRPLSEVLHIAAASATGPRAADLRAHIGFANFLRERGNEFGLSIEEEYRAAVAIDPGNPFANAMWGHFLLWKNRPLAEAEERFRAALSTPRENAYARQLWIVALLNRSSSREAAAQALRLANDVRRNAHTLDPEVRRRLITRIYSDFGRQDEPALLATLPPEEHLSTFRWLMEGRSLSESVELTYFHARLLEASGDVAAAAPLYTKLAAGESNLADVARLGFARCQQVLGRTGGVR